MKENLITYGDIRAMVKEIAKIKGGQDGAIFKNFLFRFSTKGVCLIYDLNGISDNNDDVTELAPVSQFVLDRAEEFVPHSNSVVFGSEFYSDDDEFPLLYSNIYNNYAKAENKHYGVCCVYRIVCNGNEFRSTLVQIIEVGFTDDRNYWRSSDGAEDVRPYGNFVIDAEKKLLYAFVMRDGDNSTRYFSFKLPGFTDGTVGEFGVKKVVLGIEHINDYFDVPYHNFIQGAVCHNGKVYSVEGFGKAIHPALRVIDTELKQQTLFFDFYEAGFIHEAELIDFYKEQCYYGDSRGNVFEIKF